MDPFIITQNVDLRRTNIPMRYMQPLIKGNKNAHEWIVTVTDGGKAADLSAAKAKLWLTYGAAGEGSDVSAVADATISGSVASVLFPAACYARTGEAVALMELTEGENVIGVAVLTLRIRDVKSGTVIEADETEEVDVVGLVEAIANAKAATAAANAAAEAARAAAKEAKEAAAGSGGGNGTVTGVTVNGTAYAPDENGMVNLGTIEGSGEATDAIPDYWQTHLDERVPEIRAAMSTAGFNKSAFLWYHDIHWTYGYQRAPMLLKYLYEHTPINRTNFGGDVIDEEGDDTTTMSYLWDWRSTVRDLSNHHSVPGNHDDGNTIDNRFDDPYIYAYLLAAEETPDVMRGDAGLYYYVDVPAEKTRYLYLDTATKDGNILNDTAQQEWLKQALIGTPDGWHIVAIAHIWRVYDSSYADSGWGYGAKLALDMFDAYNARTGDYSACTGKVEFCIGGHTHVDADHYSDGGILVMLTECDSKYVRSGLDCTEGTITEASVNAVIADYASGTVSVIRIGRGSSRVVALTESGDTGGDDGSGEAGGDDSGTDTPTIPEGSYTNQLSIATDTDGSIYNGVGYKADTRISTSSQTETSAAGWCLTGFIPVKIGDVIRFANVTFLDINDEASSDRAQIYLYTADKTYDGNTDAYSPEWLMSEAWDAVYGENGDVVQFTIPTSYGSTLAFIRICAKHLDEYSVITVNEEIE